jgi:hypothetical protein
VTESEGPLIGSDELIEKINAQIRASETAAMLAHVTPALPPDATLLVAEIEDQLLTAERFSQPRTSVGKAKIPGKNTPLERIFLRIHALIFRDQRNANLALITALRKSLQLNVHLAAEYARMRNGAAEPVNQNHEEAPR